MVSILLIYIGFSMHFFQLHRYLALWKKVNGEWLVYVDIFNSNVQVPLSLFTDGFLQGSQHQLSVTYRQYYIPSKVNCCKYYSIRFKMPGSQNVMFLDYNYIQSKVLSHNLSCATAGCYNTFNSWFQKYNLQLDHTEMIKQ